MAEETVVKEALTPELISAGSQLLQHLDHAGINVTACLWLYVSEANQWRLILAIPEVAGHGPKRVYATVFSKIQRRLGPNPLQLGPIAFQQISVVSPDNPLIRALQHDAPTLHRAKVGFRRYARGNNYVGDVFIYKI